uniref:Uncharacterized protein n=1 Tax=Romanomermis culicivorax TaxID=13658 RepID=A0A915J1K4_ROMCU
MQTHFERYRKYEYFPAKAQNYERLKTRTSETLVRITCAAPIYENARNILESHHSKHSLRNSLKSVIFSTFRENL